MLGMARCRNGCSRQGNCHITSGQRAWALNHKPKSSESYFLQLGLTLSKSLQSPEIAPRVDSHFTPDTITPTVFNPCSRFQGGCPEIVCDLHGERAGNRSCVQDTKLKWQNWSQILVQTAGSRVPMLLHGRSWGVLILGLQECPWHSYFGNRPILK